MLERVETQPAAKASRKGMLDFAIVFHTPRLSNTTLPLVASIICRQVCKCSEFRVYAVGFGVPPSGGPNRRKHGTPSLHLRRVPILAVIANRKVGPDAFCRLNTGLRQILRCTAPWPLRPTCNVTMSDWIVMDVIKGCPEMPIRPHGTLDSTKEHFSSTCIILSVPSM